MDDSQRLLNAIDLLYGSILDDTQWPQAMRSVAEFAGACGTFYLTADRKGGAILRCESEGIDPTVETLYSSHYASKEIRLAPAFDFPVGRGMTAAMLLDRRLLERSEIFGELLAPYDIPHVLARWVTKRAATASAFVFERSFRQGIFDRNAQAEASGGGFIDRLRRIFQGGREPALDAEAEEALQRGPDTGKLRTSQSSVTWIARQFS